MCDTPTVADTGAHAAPEPLGSPPTQRLVDALVAITSPLDLDTILARIVEGAMTTTGARYGALGVYDGTRIERFLPHGLTDDEIMRIDHWPHGEGLLGLVMHEARPVRSDDITRDPRAVGLPAGHPPMTTFLGVPVSVRGTVYGNLYLTDKAGGEPFGAEDETVVVALASAAGATIENARLHRRAREAAVADDRERIARDLHDVVVQRLFAAGLGLMSVVPRLPDDVRRVVESTVTDLDETISEIRTTISDLRSAPSNDALPLAERVSDVATAAQRVLGFPPRVTVVAEPGAEVPVEVADQLVVVLGEALTNVGRHARADEVTVELRVEQDTVVLEVADDGVGFERGGRESGLRNLASRAERLGGRLAVSSENGTGTRLRWSVPLDGADQP